MYTIAQTPTMPAVQLIRPIPPCNIINLFSRSCPWCAPVLVVPGYRERLARLQLAHHRRCGTCRSPLARLGLSLLSCHAVGSGFPRASRPSCPFRSPLPSRPAARAKRTNRHAAKNASIEAHLALSTFAGVDETCHNKRPWRQSWERTKKRDEVEDGRTRSRAAGWDGGVAST